MDERFAVAPAFSALNALGLHREHLEALARQGTLQAEGPVKRCFKLRFRHQGRRIVRYVGTDVDFVARVRDELERLQRDVREDRSVRRIVQTAKACLRQTKSCLAPTLGELGYHFWGHEIRRRRIDKQAECERSSTNRVLSKGQKVMDDRNKTQIDSLGGGHSLNGPCKPSAVKVRHQERVDELMSLALKCSDSRQALVRYGMAKSFGFGASMAERAERLLQASSLSAREFRKQVLPVISATTNLCKQGARLAQIDLEYDQMRERESDGPPLLPSDEAES